MNEGCRESRACGMLRLPNICANVDMILFRVLLCYILIRRENYYY